MTRNLKVLGMALVAALAMSAIAASAASADFFSEAEETTLTASSNSTKVFESSAGELACHEVDIDDTIVGTPVGGGYTTAAITSTPNYKNCKAFIGGSELKLKIDFDCHLLFTTDGDVHLECDEGDFVHVTVTALNLKCFTFEDQTLENAVTYTNTGEGATREVDIEAAASGIKYIEHGACGSGETTEDGVYSGSITITGEDTEGNHVGIWHEEG